MAGVNQNNLIAWYANGHYYAWSTFDAGQKWENTISESANVIIHGSKGYLANVTSTGENEFIWQHTNNGGAITWEKNRGAWIGGTDSDKYGQSETNWVWLGGESPERGERITYKFYEYPWSNGQPDNAGGGHGEDFLELLPGGLWNDIKGGDGSGVHAYITEWGVAGAEIKATINSANNGTEGSTTYPRIHIKFDKKIRHDYVDHGNKKPLVDIPFTLGGNVSYNQDYDIKVTGDSGSSSKIFVEGQKIYAADTENVYVDFIFKDDKEWDPLRSITFSLGADGSENIYELQGSSNDQVWLFDDEPQLSLGNGAYQYIDVKNDGNELKNFDITLFDNDGIDENDESYNNLGIQDKFGVRWETYLRIPEDGNYKFRLKSDDGSKLTLKKNNSAGNELFSKDSWGKVSNFESTNLTLKKGDVVWAQIDYQENKGGAYTHFYWEKNGVEEIVPSTSMFLSQDLAEKGKIISEEEEDALYKNHLALFSNKSSDEIYVDLTASSNSDPISTIETKNAQRKIGNTQIGSDYELQVKGQAIGDDDIRSQGEGIFKWTPNDGIAQNWDVNVLSDIYAEITEEFNFKLKERDKGGYGVQNSTETYTISIEDNDVIASFKPIDGNSIVEGEVGYFTVNFSEKVPELFLLKYEISGGSAIRDSDYYSPKLNLDILQSPGTDFAEDIVYVPAGSTEAKIYISAIDDEIFEDPEDIKIKLIPFDLGEDFKYRYYNVSENNNTSTITINDSGDFKAEIVITPKNRTGISTIRADLINGIQTAEFDVHLTSKPVDDVAIILTPSSGSLSSEIIEFKKNEWDKPQTIKINNISAEEITQIKAETLATLDSNYSTKNFVQTIVPSSWSTDLILSLWEGGQLAPDLPLASVKSLSDEEYGKNQFGFNISLSSPVPIGKEIVVKYKLEKGEGFNFFGPNKDVNNNGIDSLDDIYSATFTEGQTINSVLFKPIDDLYAEGNEDLKISLIQDDSYSLGGSSSSATASLIDNDFADIEALSFTKRGYDSTNNWTVSTQFRVVESNAFDGKYVPLGIQLTSKPTADVLLKLDESSFSSSEIRILNPAGSVGEPIELLFNDKNWNLVQQLQIQGVDDNIVDGENYQQISFEVITTDPFYSEIVPTVSVINIDDDSIAVESDLINSEYDSSLPVAQILTPEVLTINENDKSKSVFTISLSENTKENSVAFLDINEIVSDISKNDLKFAPGDFSELLHGLRRFSSLEGEDETSKIIFSDINESKSTFSERNLEGDFSETWSGYLYVPRSGQYSFSTKVEGGTKLKVGNSTIIDQLFDSNAMWTSNPLLLTEGEFLEVTLDYKSYNNENPEIELWWDRPVGIGEDYVNEVIPGSYFSRTKGFSVLIPKDKDSATLTIESKDDQIKEADEILALELLQSQGIEFKVLNQSIGKEGKNNLQIEIINTDRESQILEKGLKLYLGDENQEGQKDTIAEFVLTEQAIIHRDRSSNLIGEITWTEFGINTTFSESIVGLVTSYHKSPYQILDPAVLINISDFKSGEEANTYLATLSLSETNRDQIILPSGTKLIYTIEAKEGDLYPKTFTVITKNETTISKTAGSENIAVEITNATKELNLTELTESISSIYEIPINSKITFKDDDIAGITFSSDQNGEAVIDDSIITIKENGQEEIRYLKLTSQPNYPVTVYLESTDNTELLLSNFDADKQITSPETSRIGFTFNSRNWSKAQAFKINPVDDDLVDGTQEVKIKSLVTSSDNFYNEVNNYKVTKLDSINLQNEDDDQPSLKVDLQQKSIYESSNGFINFNLSSKPSSEVSVKVSASDDNQFYINDNRKVETLQFDSNNWDLLQSIQVQAIDDNNVEDITTSNLSFEITSKDNNFNNIKVDPVQIDIVDNDLPYVSLIPISDSSEEAEPGSFRIELSEPAPSSKGSNGIVVNYEITNIDFDSEAFESLEPPSDPYGIDTSMGYITQSPGKEKGSVRIPPGQKYSDVIVVPIDDKVDENIDKSFTISAVSGDDYTLNSNDSLNSATIKIIDDDVAGFYTLFSGDYVQVAEDRGSAEFLIGLLTQPKGDVEITISERKILNKQQLGQDGDKDGKADSEFEKTINITQSDWFTAQKVEIEAYDDFTIEDGIGENKNTGIHSAQIEYKFKSTDDKYNSSDEKGAKDFTNTIQNIEVIDFALPDKTAESIQKSLINIQDGIDSLALPMVGGLEGKTGDGLRKFITNLTNSIQQIGTPTPKKLSAIISQEISSALGIKEDEMTVTVSDNLLESEQVIEVKFKFNDGYDLKVPLASDFGIPGLGFKSNGNLDANFGYEAGFNLVFARNGDIYLNTDSENTYLSGDFNTSLSDDFKLTGGLGLFQIDAVNQSSKNDAVQIQNVPAKTEMDANFVLTLDGGKDSKLSFAELGTDSNNSEDLFEYTFSGDAAMSFGVETSVQGSAAIPSFNFDLSSKLPLFDYSNQDETSKDEYASNFYFDNIQLDLGSYITEMLDPVLDGVNTILEPIYPIVDSLYADTQIFNTIGLESTFDYDKDKHVSTIDLANWFADFYYTIDQVEGAKLSQTVKSTTNFLDNVKGVMDLIRDLETLSETGNFYVDFGNYQLESFKASDSNSKTNSHDPGISNNQTSNSTQNLNANAASDANKGGKDIEGNSSTNFADIMSQLDDLGFAIPIVDDPKNAIKLLLGYDDVNLLTWNLPGMGMSSEISKNFPIYPGIEGVIEGGFGVDAAIGFGFDNSGLVEWSNDDFALDSSWKAFNGFYVADWHGEENEDTPELTLDASMGAGLGLSAVVVRSDITGGLLAEASFDLLDEGEVAGTSDGKIRGNEIANLIKNPLDLFELTGDLSAYLNSKVQMGVDMGFYSIWETVYEENLAEIPIFEFGVGGSYGTGTASNGYLLDSTIFFDSNFNGKIESSEPYILTSEDAHFNLKVDHKEFDLNRDNKISLDEGRLMAFGGTDQSTNLSLNIPFFAPLESKMLTPLTTIYTLGVKQGLSETDTLKWIKDGFELGDFDIFNDDPKLYLDNSRRFSDIHTPENFKAYLAHTKLQLNFDFLSNSLQKLLPNQFSNDINTELEILEGFAKGLFAQESSVPVNTLLYNASKTLYTNLNLNLKTDSFSQDSYDLVCTMAADANYELGMRLDDLYNYVISKTGSNASLLDEQSELLNTTKINSILQEISSEQTIDFQIDSITEGTENLIKNSSDLVLVLDKIKSISLEHYRKNLDELSDGLHKKDTTFNYFLEQALENAHSDFVSRKEKIMDLVTGEILNYEIGKKYPLPYIKDFDGNLHGGSYHDLDQNAYKYHGNFDVNIDGNLEAIYTNNQTGRWVTASIDKLTGETNFKNNGLNGSTRVVGLFEDPLIKEGENNGGYLSDGVTPAPANFGVSDADRYVQYDGVTVDRLALNSQARFQNDLLIDNLTPKLTGDFDGDGVNEIYWKTNDGTAYLRTLMHDDGNISYANYQSFDEMKEYLTGNNFHNEIQQIT